MKNHLKSEHGIAQDSSDQVCPLCLEKVSGRCELISLHFSRHMEEIALAVLPRTAGSEDGSDYGPKVGSVDALEDRISSSLPPTISPASSSSCSVIAPGPFKKGPEKSSGKEPAIRASEALDNPFTYPPSYQPNSSGPTAIPRNISHQLSTSNPLDTAQFVNSDNDLGTIEAKKHNSSDLELPSISSIHSRGPVDTWYNSHYAPRPAVSSDPLPALAQQEMSSHRYTHRVSTSPPTSSYEFLYPLTALEKAAILGQAQIVEALVNGIEKPTRMESCERQKSPQLDSYTPYHPPHSLTSPAMPASLVSIESEQYSSTDIRPSEVAGKTEVMEIPPHVYYDSTVAKDKGDSPASPMQKASSRRGRAAPPGRCLSCNRAETPEWRRGPDGARTLCNACGLRKLPIPFAY